MTRVALGGILVGCGLASELHLLGHVRNAVLIILPIVSMILAWLIAFQPPPPV
jgi:hypothetical protein